MKYLLTVFIFILLLSPYCLSKVWEVPGDCPTIQAGIDSCSTGDTVMVSPGTYVENIDFLGKAIVVVSLYGPDSTVIDGNQEGSVVTFANGESVHSVIEGFTITNGSGTFFDPYWEYGGGRYLLQRLGSHH